MRTGSLLNSNIGDYHLVDFLGAGGMGEVYRAVHAKIGKVVAIKVLTSQTRHDGLSERFINEARIQARLHHQGIATLYDYTEVSGHPCIVMEYIGGQTLDEFIKLHGSLTSAASLQIFQSVAEAVAYIHAHQIVHRDIKSNNIKIGPGGEVKLLDFGIAKSESSPKLTMKGDVIGTIRYMSPEQLKGGAADARSDIWSLGILLYEMLTGDVPFQAETMGELFEQIKNGEYVRPSTIDPFLPRETEAILTRCLKKNPAQRYQSVEEMLADIRRLRRLQMDEQAENPEPKPARFSPLAQKRAVWVASLVLTLLALSSIAVLYFAANGISPSPVAHQFSAPTPVNFNSPQTSNSELKSVLIQAIGGEAEVYQHNEKVGSTPYELKERLGNQVDLVLKRKGFTDKRVAFSVTENKKEYTVVLDPLEGP